MKSVSHRIALTVASAAAAASLTGCGVNAIPTKEEHAKQAWANVQSTYQRRSDLIPNLVATVKGYAAQEKSVLVEVTQARASATSVTVDPSRVPDPATFQKYANAQGALSASLGRLLLVQERYPDLKSNANFMALQSELEGTENRINIARRDFNEAATDYNISLRTFPTVIWAKTFYGSSHAMPLFTAAAQAQTAPSVDFSQPGATPAPAAPK